jgi:hypothetical protein
MPGYPAAATPAMPDSGALSAMAAQKEVWYLGTKIPDPDQPAASLAQTKVPGYEPVHDYARLTSTLVPSLYTTEISCESGFLLSFDPGSYSCNQVVKFILATPLLQRDALNDYCMAKAGKDLFAILQSTGPNRVGLTTKHVTTVVKALIRGPLNFDVDLLYDALSGVG